MLHPRRDPAEAVGAILDWAARHDAEVVGLPDEVDRLGAGIERGRARPAVRLRPAGQPRRRRHHAARAAAVPADRGARPRREPRPARLPRRGRRAGPARRARRGGRRPLHGGDPGLRAGRLRRRHLLRLQRRGAGPPPRPPGGGGRGAGRGAAVRPVRGRRRSSSPPRPARPRTASPPAGRSCPRARRGCWSSRWRRTRRSTGPSSCPPGSRSGWTCCPPAAGWPSRWTAGWPGRSHPGQSVEVFLCARAGRVVRLGTTTFYQRARRKLRLADPAELDGLGVQDGVGRHQLVDRRAVVGEHPRGAGEPGGRRLVRGQPRHRAGRAPRRSRAAAAAGGSPRSRGSRRPRRRAWRARRAGRHARRPTAGWRSRPGRTGPAGSRSRSPRTPRPAAARRGSARRPPGWSGARAPPSRRRRRRRRGRTSRPAARSAAPWRRRPARSGPGSGRRPAAAGRARPRRRRSPAPCWRCPGRDAAR